MVELVCLDVTQGPDTVGTIRRLWDAGHAVFPLDQRLPATAKRALIAAVRPTRIIEANGETSLPDRAPAEPGDAVVVVTSGSSGEPKAVVHTHDSVVASARATSARLGVTADDIWLACLPISHIGGLSVVMRSMVTGVPVIVQPKFTVEGYEHAANDGATLVSLVHTALTRVDAHRYRTVLLGGSAAPVDLPDNVVTTYGMTETGSGVVYDGHALDGVEIRIVDGEIHIRCKMLMRGYRNAPTTIDADGWLHTGDIGSMSPDGRLTVTGRRGDMIISGGENIWPEPIERVLSHIAGVRDCAVVGVSDAEWGQRVVAVVDTTPGESVTIDAIRAAVKEQLPAFMAPHDVVHMPIPRTQSGKIQRHLIVGALGGRSGD